ncbi:MAG: TIR domain-containing protein [Bryobacteraceae bacterium]
MPKVFPCYSPLDRELARDLAGFLERGAGVEVLLEEGEMQPGEDLIAKVGDALSADVALALLSPHSVPAKWVLERWQAAFWRHAEEVGTAVGTLLCADCRFPDLLRRKSFFDLRKDRRAGFRAVKRWLQNLFPAPQQAPFVPAAQVAFQGRELELETLCELLADAPGIVVVSNAAPGSGKTALALEFAHRHREDYDAIFWLTCGGRTVAALAGDLAAQIGVRLDGDIESNLSHLRQLCARYRCFLVLDDASLETASVLAPRGRTSVLIATRCDNIAEPLSAEEIRLMAHSHNDPAAITEAIRRLDSEDQNLLAAMCACASSGFRLSLAARTADLTAEEADEAADRFVAKGLLTPLDENGPRYTVPVSVRRACGKLRPASRWEFHHAKTVADWFDAQTWASQDLTPDWPDLECALDRALSASGGADSWKLATNLARRAVAWARAHERLAEAFEILKSWSDVAEKRGDRRVLEDCAWEQMWILEHWGRTKEAIDIDNVRRRKYSDQMTFEFS